MKYVAAIVIVLAMLVGVYFFMNKTDNGSKVGETEAEKAAREAAEAAAAAAKADAQAKAHRDAFTAEIASRPHLAVAERRASILSDPNWTKGVSDNVGKGKEHSDFETALTWAALKAAQLHYGSLIMDYDVIPLPGTGAHKEFKVLSANGWETYNSANTWAEYSEYQLSKLA